MVPERAIEGVEAGQVEPRMERQYDRRQWVSCKGVGEKRGSRRLSRVKSVKKKGRVGRIWERNGGERGERFVCFEGKLEIG